MSIATPEIVRWLATTAVAAVGGGILMVAIQMPDDPTPTLPQVPRRSGLLVAAVRGGHYARAGASSRRLAVVGQDVLPRPATLYSRSPRDRIVVDDRSARMVVHGPAKVHFGLSRDTLDVARGGAVARSSRPVAITAHHLGVRLVGQAVGLFVNDAHVTAVSLVGRAEFTAVGMTSTTTLEGAQVLLGVDDEPISLPDRLTLEVEEVFQRSRGTRVVGISAPGARVRLRVGQSEAESEVDRNGRYEVEVPWRRGAYEILARDALGRQARPGAPSRTLAEVLDTLRPGSNPILSPSDASLPEAAGGGQPTPGPGATKVKLPAQEGS